MEITDPALELATVCRCLMVQTDERGDEFLGKQFGVEPWSFMFFKIVFSIVERAERVGNIIEESQVDPMVKEAVLGHVGGIKTAFSRSSMATKWGAGGNIHLLSHVPPLLTMSPEIRRIVSYPRPSVEEIEVAAADVRELLVWLRKHQLEEKDGIRVCLIEGLENLLLRIEKLGWLGWNETAQALRDVVGAYLAMERGFPEPELFPIAQATIAKIYGAVTRIYQAIGVTKEVADRGNLLLSIYGAWHLVQENGVAGYIGSLSK